MDYSKLSVKQILLLIEKLSNEVDEPTLSKLKTIKGVEKFMDLDTPKHTTKIPNFKYKGVLFSNLESNFSIDGKVLEKEIVFEINGIGEISFSTSYEQQSNINGNSDLEYLEKASGNNLKVDFQFPNIQVVTAFFKIINFYNSLISNVTPLLPNKEYINARYEEYFEKAIEIIEEMDFEKYNRDHLIIFLSFMEHINEFNNIDKINSIIISKNGEEFRLAFKKSENITIDIIVENCKKILSFVKNQIKIGNNVKYYNIFLPRIQNYLNLIFPLANFLNTKKYLMQQNKIKYCISPDIIPLLIEDVKKRLITQLKTILKAEYTFLMSDTAQDIVTMGVIEGDYSCMTIDSVSGHNHKLCYNLHDKNSKIFKVINEAGKTIARAMIRLCKNQNQDDVIYVDKIYTAAGSVLQNKKVFLDIIKKYVRTNIPIVSQIDGLYYEADFDRDTINALKIDIANDLHDYIYMDTLSKSKRGWKKE